ncbi:hypothetical protein B0H10DRAFT_1981949 [Mycena sp. CBHHK59/15]|nr:hypothetical protein B0H10DRAFT_1981949 [Mycena sp. CBHHK59/15]
MDGPYSNEYLQKLRNARNPYDSEDFATLLGLKKEISESGDGVLYEMKRLYCLCAYLQRNRMQPQHEQDIVLAQFCAAYLPGTVDQFLDKCSPSGPLSGNTPMQLEIVLNNAYLEMLVYMQYSPYFSKFLHSSPNGKQLSQQFSERLAALGSTWDRNISHPPRDRPDGYYESVARSSVCLLSTICAAFAKETDHDSVISQVTRETLISLFTRWATLYKGEPLGEASFRAARILAHEPDIQEATHRVRRHCKNWNVCGMPKCNKKTSLKACGRCQTVRYVSELSLPHLFLCDLLE